MVIFTKRRKGVELWGELRAGMLFSVLSGKCFVGWLEDNFAQDFFSSVFRLWLFEVSSIQVVEHFICVECYNCFFEEGKT